MGNEHSTGAAPSEHSTSPTSSSPSPETARSSQQQPDRRTSSRKTHCTWGLHHASLKECEADPRSSRYAGFIKESSDTDIEVTPETEAELKMPLTAENKRPRKALQKKEEQPKMKRKKVMNETEADVEDCDCDAGHESLVECENEAKKKTIDLTMSIIIGSQGVVTIHVGTDSSKQSFLVHRELLTLHSDYFCSLITTEIKTEIKDEDEKKIKVEKFDESEQDAAKILDARFPSPLEGQSQPTYDGVRLTSPSEQSSSSEIGGRSSSSSLLESLLTPSPSVTPCADAALHTCLQNAIIAENSPKSQPQVTTSLLTKATPTNKTVTEIYVPELNPTHFATFLSFLYTGSVTPSVYSLQSSSQPHAFPTLYILASQLQSASFQNHLMSSHRRLLYGQWPSAEQAKHIYDVIAAYKPLQCSTGRGGGQTDVEMLRKFTASCMAANNLLERHGKGTPEHDEWSKLFLAKPEIGVDVIGAQSVRWHEMKPWDDVFRKEFLVEVKTLGEKWKDEITMAEKRTWSEIRGAVERGRVGILLQLGVLGMA